MNKELPSPILITGAARSGTSMIAGIINMCGAFGGDMSGATRNNKRGMFENAKIRNTIVKPYLEQIGVDKMGQYPLPDVDNLLIPSNLKQRVEDVIKEQGYESGAWMYKGAKMCLTWPIWHYAFPNAKWVIVRRRTGDITKSCVKTGFMQAFNSQAKIKAVGAKTEEEGWLWWARQHEKRFVEMITEGLNCKVVWPHRMVNGDYQQVYETLDWLGLKWKSEVLNFVDPMLWHARNKQKQEIKTV